MVGSFAYKFDKKFDSIFDKKFDGLDSVLYAVCFDVISATLRLKLSQRLAVVVRSQKEITFRPTWEGPEPLPNALPFGYTLCLCWFVRPTFITLCLLLVLCCFLKRPVEFALEGLP